MESEGKLDKRFLVALSFPGEKRDYVRKVVKHLSKSIDNGRIFFDENFEADIARNNADIYLGKIYGNQSHLVVPFFCEDYENKPWCCNVEWPSIRETLIFNQSDDYLMAMQFDNTQINGLPRTCIPLKIGNRLPVEIARLILKRLESMGLVGSPNSWHAEKEDELERGPKINLNTFIEVDSRTTKSPHVNRKRQLALLDQALKSNDIHIVEFVAWSGVGKSSMLKHWIYNLLSKNDWYGVKRVYAWKFDNPQADEDSFFDNAYKWFGILKEKGESPHIRGQKLANALIQERTLIILDGIEYLQYPPGHEGGKLKALGLKELLCMLALKGSHPCLCVVTTHQEIRDLYDFHEPSVIVPEFENMPPKDGAEILYNHGVTCAGIKKIRKDDKELQEASEDVNGHALTLMLLGSYIKKQLQGDVRQRHQVKLDKADREGRHNTFEMLRAWERLFKDSGEEAAPLLATLRMMGLFNREVDNECLKALLNASILNDLTTGYRISMNEEDLNSAISHLEDSLLVNCSYKSCPERSLFVGCHRLIHEYFAATLREDHIKTYKKAHFFLYNYFVKKANNGQSLPGQDGLQSLYDAVNHGCLAGHAQEAYEKTYLARIHQIKQKVRGPLAPNDFHATAKYGMFSRDFVAINCFFKKTWRAFLPGLNDQAKVELLRRAAFLLQILGWVVEVRKPLEAAEFIIKSTCKTDWKTRAALVSRAVNSFY